MRSRWRTLFRTQRISLLACLLVTLFLLCYLSLWKTVKPNVCGIVCATSEKETWTRRAVQAAGEKAKLIPKVDVPRGRDQPLTVRHHDDPKSDDMRHTDQHASASLNGLRYHRGGASDGRRYENTKTSPAESDTSVARPELEGDRTSPTGSRHGPGNISLSRPMPVHIQGDTSSTLPKHDQDSATSSTLPKHDQDSATSSTLPKHDQDSATSSTLPKHDQDSATSTRPKHNQDSATSSTLPKHNQDSATSSTLPKHNQDSATSSTLPKHDQDSATSSTLPKHNQDSATSSTLPTHNQNSATSSTRPKLDRDRTPPGHARKGTSPLAASQDETSAMNSSTHYQNKSTNIETQEGYMQSNYSLYDKWTREQELKKRHVQETCDSLRNDSRAAHLKYELTEAVLQTLNHLLVVDSRKIIYCYIPKIGCTSWKRILLVLLEKFKRVEDVSHIDAHYTPIPNLSKFTIDEVKQRLRNYTTFIITRDPFKRVVSCFRDKFETDNPDNRALQRNVMKGLQGKSGNYSKSYKILPKVDFPQFARYVADPRNTFGHYGPTEHWNEAYRLCHPCLVRYDFIGEFDTLIRDSELILKAAGLDNTVGFPGATNPTNSSGDAVKNKYLSLLNKTEITALNKRYEIDSELFGYSDQPAPG